MIPAVVGIAGCAGIAGSKEAVNPSTPTMATITAQPSSLQVTAGQTAAFSVVATGTAPLTYQWQKNGVSISGASSASYTTLPTTITDNGTTFQVVVSNPAGSVTSGAATLTVNPAVVAPSITTEPASESVLVGQTATLSVVAGGTAPLSYQWQKNGANISGATSATYTTPATASADNGSTFKVVVSNSAGSVTSSAATLTVSAAVVAPTIATQPTNQTVTAGQTATFTVLAAGTSPLSYQWQKNGANISGAASSSYTTPATTTANNGSTFAVGVSNSAGSVTSSAATLTVSTAVVAPTIATQPTNQTVTAGQTATFTVLAAGTAPLSYQWQQNGTNINGAASSSYTTPATTTANSGSTFAVVVSNSAGSVTSSAATLTVSTAVVAPTITTQPTNQTVTAGQTATFSVTASGTAPLSYQWQKNGANISGATSASYTTPATASADNSSTFKVVVSNSAGNITSNAATLTVTAAAVAPTIATQPANQTVTAGQTATFTVLAAGTAPLSYQWQKNGANISGAASSSYTTPATTTANNGSTFAVVVSNSAGSVTSSAATLTVTADTTPPTVSITSPSSGATLSGTITVTASASDNVAVASVQLQVDGTNVGAAVTTSPYSFSLNTTTLSNGSHDLTAVATDTSGNQATSIAIPFTVSNQSGATPTYANNGAGCPINQVSTNLTDTLTSYTCPLPNPTGQGNLLVLLLRYAAPSQAPSFRDNVGGNTYTEAISCTDSTNGHVSAIYYAENVTAGVNRVTVSFGAGTHYVQMSPFEFYNIATASALDQAQCNVGSGTAVSAGSLATLGASGDLILQFGIVDNLSSITSCTPGAQTNITWTMRMTMIAEDEPSCGQYGIYNSTTSFNPSFTLSNSADYISTAAAFKPVSAGTAPPAGIRVVYVQHDDTQNETASSVSLQYPISGNTMAMVYSSGCTDVSPPITDCSYPTSASDGTNKYTQVGSTIISQFNENGGNSVGSIFYAKGVVPGLYSPTWAMHPRSNGGNGNSFILYDIVGASANPLDTNFGTSGLASTTFNQDTGLGSGPITTFTATPSQPNEVIVGEIGAGWDSFTGLSSPAGAQFLSCNYLTETNPSHCDLNGGWGLYYNGASTAAETWIWTHDASNYPGAGAGVALGAAFVPSAP
jgi:hypothetical protein